MNTVSFHYDEKKHEMVVYYHHGDVDHDGNSEERELLGTIPPAHSQRAKDLYDWADARIALLGLAPIRK